MKAAILWLSFALAAAALLVFTRDDWLYVTRRRRRVSGVVTGYRSREEDGALSFAAILRFEDEQGRSVEVVDRLFRPSRMPPIGTQLLLEHPARLPDRARVRRPWQRVFVYAILAYMIAIVLLVMLGRL